MTDATTTEAWFSSDVATFGDRLAGAREAEGQSQEDLARRLGVSVKAIRAWEDDVSEPRANRLQMLAGMLNVSLRWLLTGEGDGVETTTDSGPLGSEAQVALADMARMRAQMLALTHEMAQMERRLSHLMRAER